MSDSRPSSIKPSFECSVATSGSNAPRTGSSAAFKRPPPFSLRLTSEERAYLQKKAGSVPLGAYIKSRIFADGGPVKKRGTGIAIEDKKALAQALGLLGQTHYASNLNQLARAANTGTLPVTSETEDYIVEACQHIADLKALFMQAMGMKDKRAS